MIPTSFRVVTRAVIIDANHILLCKLDAAAEPFYFLPGGKVEQSESAPQALLRELQEELGVTCAIKGFLGVFEQEFTPSYETRPVHQYNLIFSAASTMLFYPSQPRSLDTHTTFEWIPLRFLPTIDLRPQHLHTVLPLWLSNERHNTFYTTLPA